MHKVAESRESRKIHRISFLGMRGEVHPSNRLRTER
jgi:hypothetical protein